MSGPGVHARGVEPVARAVCERTGLAFSPARRASVEAAIERTCGGDPAGFLRRVEADPQALQPLLAELTVGETYFFREPAQLEFLIRTVIPPLLTRQPVVRVWSAGCATGEEPYSVAMLARAAGSGHRVKVLGTDLSAERIARAREGAYGGWSTRGGHNALLAAHSTPWRRGFRLAAELRRAVDFRVLNLARDPFPAAQDVILCRNVLIYLDKDAVRAVAQRMVDALTDDGWLLLGASDPQIAEFVRCRAEVTPGGLAYRPDRRQPWTATKPHPATHPSAPAAPRVAAAAGAGRPKSAPRPSPVSAARCAAEDAESAMARIRALSRVGKLDEAVTEATAALERDRSRAALWSMRSMLLAQRGMHREAAEDARRALYLDGTLAAAHVALGMAIQRLGDRAGAARTLRRGAELLDGLARGAAVPASMGELAGPLLGLVRATLDLLDAEETP